MVNNDGEFKNGYNLFKYIFYTVINQIILGSGSSPVSECTGSAAQWQMADQLKILLTLALTGPDPVIILNTAEGNYYTSSFLLEKWFGVNCRRL